MWNLMNVMQVMAYLRLLVDWPANSHMILDSMHNAITLENILKEVKDSYFSDFVDQQEDDEELETLQRSGIQSKNILLSFGIFAIALAALIFVLVVYLVLRMLSLKIRCCRTIQSLLEEKLFYNAWIRYMVQSNLKITHNCIFYLVISGSNGSAEDNVSTLFRIVLLVLILVWPVLCAVILCCSRDRLGDKAFKKKFISMYNGLRVVKIQVDKPGPT